MKVKILNYTLREGISYVVEYWIPTLYCTPGSNPAGGP